MSSVSRTVRFCTPPVRKPLGPPLGSHAGYLIIHCTFTVHAPQLGVRVAQTAGVSVLDLVYVLGIIAVFALVGLVAWGVEKL